MKNIFAFSLLIFCLQVVADDSQLSCLLEPSSRIELSSQVRGVVKSVSVERGQKVRPGQELIVLHNGLEKALLETAKAKYEFSKRKLERNKNLLAQKLLSDFEQDEMVTEKKLAELAVLDARERLKQRTILSPVSGLVVKRHVRVGEFVGEDPVLELVSLDPLYAEVVFRSDAWGELKKGMKVDVEVFGSVSTRLQGSVKIVDQLIDPASGTFGVRIVVPNPKNALPSGLKCQISYSSSQTSDVETQ